MNTKQPGTFAARYRSELAMTPEGLLDLLAKHHDFKLPIRSRSEGLRLLAFLQSLQQQRYPELQDMSPASFERLRKSVESASRFWVEDPTGRLAHEEMALPRRYLVARVVAVLGASVGGYLGANAPRAGDIGALVDVLGAVFLAAAVGAGVALVGLCLFRRFRVSRIDRAIEAHLAAEQLRSNDACDE